MQCDVKIVDLREQTTREVSYFESVHLPLVRECQLSIVVE